MAVSRYFAYGSNLNAERVRERGLSVVGVTSAFIDGLGLRFDKVSAAHPAEAHANIVYAPGERVEGALYELAGPDEILKMDRFERAPINYGREVVLVSTAVGKLAAWTYFANAHARAEGLRPSQAYLDHLLAGAPLLTPSYLAKLQAQPVSER